MNASPPETDSSRWSVVILIVAMGLRVGFVIFMESKLKSSGQEFLISGDAEGYWELGRRIAYGEDYAVHDPPRYVHRMPGFPALLAMSITLFGESHFAARLFLSLLGLFACWLVYKLGVQLDSRRTGLIAAALAAVSPTFVGFSGVVLSETAFSVALLLAVLASARLISTLQTIENQSQLWRPIGDACLVGTMLALGVYMKPSWILAGPILAALIGLGIRPVKRSFIPAVCIVAAMYFCLFPWGLRNAQVSGHFTFTTFWMGPSLYDGLQPGATGGSDMAFFDRDQLPQSLSEYEVDQEYRQRAKQLALEDPARVIRLAVAKFLRFWNLWPNADQFQNRWICIGMTAFYMPVFGLVLVGVMAWRKRIWSLVICAGPIIYFTGIHLIFVSSLRYRLPAEYPLLVLAAAGLQLVFAKLRKFQSPHLSSNRN